MDKFPCTLFFLIFIFDNFLFLVMLGLHCSMRALLAGNGGFSLQGCPPLVGAQASAHRLQQSQRPGPAVPALAQAPERTAFSSCAEWTPYQWPSGSVAAQHGEPPQSRDGTHVPCTGRRILIHCTAREVQSWCFKVLIC